MSKTTERILWEAAEAGVSVQEYLAAKQCLEDQAIEAYLMDQGRMIVDMDVEEADYTEELGDGRK